MTHPKRYFSSMILRENGFRFRMFASLFSHPRSNDRLDSVIRLDDFKDLNLSQRNQREDVNMKKEKEEKDPLASGIQVLGMGLPDMRSKKKGNRKCRKRIMLLKLLIKLREQTRETVKGLESISSSKQLPDSDDDGMVEDFLKQFEDLAGCKEHQLSHQEDSLQEQS